MGEYGPLPVVREDHTGSLYLRDWTGDPLHRRKPQHRRRSACCGCCHLAARFPLVVGIIALSLYSAMFTALLYLCITDKARPVSASKSSNPSFTPILPPSYPLAVGSPYLSAWMPGSQVSSLPSAAPQFWNGQKLGWSVIARVDQKTYSLFGVPSPSHNVTSGVVRGATYTATHSTFFVDAGSASFALDFFTPVSPNNYERQSRPFSYLTISASGNSDESPSVQVYSDIDSSWTGHFEYDARTKWTSTIGANNTVAMTFTPDNGAPFSEINDVEWGTSVYSARRSGDFSNGLTHAMGDLARMRNDFTKHGLAYAHELGKLDTTKNVTFVLGYVRDTDVDYMGDARQGFWKAACGGDDQILCGCRQTFDDFAEADAESRTLDAAIVNHAGEIGGHKYSDILQLSVRQTFGAMDLTIPNNLNTSDVMVFQKGIGGNGNVNTIDDIFSLAPILYVMAPEWIRFLTEPVMRYLASEPSGANIVLHDIGDHYPNATGHDNDYSDPMPLADCGDTILLMHTYQKATSNTEWVAQYSSLLQIYADYLVERGLYPDNQPSNDGAGEIANQTSLAIKSAIALNAFGLLTSQSSYSDIGLQFADTLYNEGAGLDSERTHFTLIQGEDGTWTISYDLYMDLLLDLQTMPSEAYDLQSAYYSKVRSEDGVSLDSRVGWGQTSWMMWAAATASVSGHDDVKEMFINDIHAFLANGQSNVPFGDQFFVAANSSDGAEPGTSYGARPVVGGHFALMALEGATMF